MTADQTAAERVRAIFECNFVRGAEVGASVAVSGIIGFVGLIVPHMLRSVLGSDHRTLLPNSAILGAALLTLADIVSRTIIAPAELPIGIVTALIGTPVFVILLIKQKKQLKLMS